ncbi:MAG: hypothetical protein ACRBEQ_10020 [Hyphomonas sp.]
MLKKTILGLLIWVLAFFFLVTDTQYGPTDPGGCDGRRICIVKNSFCDESGCGFDRFNYERIKYEVLPSKHVTVEYFVMCAFLALLFVFAVLAIMDIGSVSAAKRNSELDDASKTVDEFD